MQLSFEQIMPLVHGAERKFEKDGTLWMLRFTEAQADFYKDDKEMYEKSAATAGVHLDFTTNSRSLKLELDTVHADTVAPFWVDIYVNETHTLKLQASLADSKQARLPLTALLSLPAGNKHIAVYLPWTGCTGIRSLELSDGAAFSPICHKLKMVCYGDSITHGSWGADASSPYVTRLAHALDAEAINKGLGGDIFRAGFSAIPGGLSPDIVTIAYGTNDWNDKTDAKELAARARKFYSDAAKSYPDAKIFAISPIWRNGAETKIRKVGSFFEVRDILKAAARGLPNVIFIDGYDLVPHKPEMYSPDLLHPSDLGFAHYAENLLAAIRPYLD